MTHHSSLPKTLLLATILSAGLGAPLMASAPELPEADTGAGVGGSVSALPPIIQAPPQEEMTDIPLTTPAAPAPAKKGWSLWPFSSSTPTEVPAPAPTAAPLQEALLEAVPSTDVTPATQSATEPTATNEQMASDASTTAAQSAPEKTDTEVQAASAPLATSPQGRSLLNLLTFGILGYAGTAADVTTSVPSAAPQENGDPSLADTAILATATPEAVAQDPAPDAALSAPVDSGVAAAAEEAIPQEAVLDAALSAPSSSGVDAAAQEEVIEDYVPPQEPQLASSSDPFANLPGDVDVTSSVIFGAEMAARLAAQKHIDGHISFSHPWKGIEKPTVVDLPSFGKNFSAYGGATYALSYGDQTLSLPGTLLATAVEQNKGLEGVWLKEVFNGEEKLASFAARDFDDFAPEEATAPGYVPANHLFFDKIACDAQLTNATQSPAACITVNGESFTISTSDVVTFLKDKNKLRVRFSYVQRFLSENANTDLKVVLINRRVDSANIKMYEAAS